MYIFVCKRNPEEDLYVNTTGSLLTFTKMPKIWKSYVALQTFIRSALYSAKSDYAIWRKDRNRYIKENSRILGYKIDLDKPDINLSLEEFQKIKIPKES